MEFLPATILSLLLLAALLRGLQNGYYVLHMLLCAAALWLLLHHLFPGITLARPRAIALAICVHLLSINIITWLAYYRDKRASRINGWRVPERTLHAFTLVGGTPAAWLAQKMLRHKTKKRSFQIMFWAIFLLQLSAAVYLGQYL